MEWKQFSQYTYFNFNGFTYVICQFWCAPHLWHLISTTTPWNMEGEGPSGQLLGDSDCSSSKGVRNPNLWHAAVDNVLAPQIPLLVSGRTTPGVVLKQFPFHAKVIKLEDSCLQKHLINTCSHTFTDLFTALSLSAASR